jgi:hypothetical protein
LKNNRTGYIRAFFLAAGLWALVLSFVLPRPAFAACETAGAANAALATIPPIETDYLNRFITQEESFMDNIMQTAFKNLVDYYTKFAKNIQDALSEWASEDWYGGLQGMTKELHLSQVDQTFHVGRMMNAQLTTEQGLRYGNLLIDAKRRYAPSQLACEMDSTGPGLSRAYQISRAFNRGLAMDNGRRASNAAGSISATGTAAELKRTWDEYVAKFCDNTMGDQGCATPGTVAGRHKDLGSLLWGSKMTIDPTNPDNLVAIQSSLRYLVAPLAPDPIPPTAATSTPGHFAILARHADLAYLNTIYNTLGAMISERLGGSGVNVQQMRAAAGVPPADASTNASYREIQEAMTRDRFHNPEYLVRLIGDPAQVAREQTTLDALRLQTMNDIFHRTEERLFMESAQYARDLNMLIPKAAAPNIPLVHFP